ncbi:hypothetical protein [Sporomusa termitida]|uniref:CobQ/CobB/MinD/ParA nucleotide binding domain-containing protein n=1 Tax=Sporomusa termitida TaxID=2377 RepID=A0A517DNL2_9FIRM|nr:hypothetical protein [Sporomusa termitida]QDR78960.1 hypothetical protein SPTER_02110 [Sporomusa termitida]
MQAGSNFLQQGARIKVFLGEFGSGKTELAINWALQTRQLGYKTAIVDMDLVKPFFHTRDHRALLTANGVEVIAADQRFAQAELPVLPHDLSRVLSRQDYQVVMDVGGGEAAIVLAQFQQRFAANPYQALLVVNGYRPFTNTVDGVIAMLQRIEGVSGLKMAGLVSNANLGAETTVEHVRAGIILVEAVAARLALPVTCIVVPEWLAGQVDTLYPVFSLHPYNRFHWQG